MASAEDLSPNVNSKPITHQALPAEDSPQQLSPTPTDILEICRGTKDDCRDVQRRRPGSRGNHPR
jgi:hypothetical protein